MKSVIIELKKSRQSLVFMDSIQCNVRAIVGQSPADKLMHEVVNELKSLGIVETATGYYSLAEYYTSGGFVYLTSLSLNKEWFKGKPIRKVEEGQLNLFEAA